MKVSGVRSLLWFAVLAIATSAVAQMQHAPLKPDARFDKIKSLAGEWEGSMIEGGEKYPASASVRVVSDGSAVIHELAKGTPYDMITMFHQDGNDLMATHYCAGHNQPRMKLVSSDDPKTLMFDFFDGTNLDPNYSHMKGVKITFVDADHHNEDWSSVDHGKITTAHFEFQRKKS